ncbi:hypothetical protein ACVXJT_27015, partial [Klebsiella pneumoniae]
HPASHLAKSALTSNAAGPKEEFSHLTDMTKAAEHTFSSRACGAFSRFGHMLDHKTSLNKLKTNSFLTQTA